MKRVLARFLALSLLSMLVFAPSVGAQGQEITVSMEDNFFDAANITVEPGTTVTWVQNGDNPHTTTSYDGLWDSGMLEGGSGNTFSFTFDEPGTYDYYCIPHENLGMVGSVTVTDAATASPTATATASPEAPALSETGGAPVPLMATLAASLALVVSGLIALALLRRSGSSS
jgi:plastocyanin